MNTTARETDRTGTRRMPGVPLDSQTRSRLSAYIARMHWRPACAAIAVAPAVLRRALAGDRVRAASALAIRVALAADDAQIGGAP